MWQCRQAAWRRWRRPARCRRRCCLWSRLEFFYFVGIKLVDGVSFVLIAGDVVVAVTVVDAGGKGARCFLHWLPSWLCPTLRWDCCRWRRRWSASCRACLAWRRGSAGVWRCHCHSPCGRQPRPSCRVTVQVKAPVAPHFNGLDRR